MFPWPSAGITVSPTPITAWLKKRLKIHKQGTLYACRSWFLNYFFIWIASRLNKRATRTSNSHVPLSCGDLTSTHRCGTKWDAEIEPIWVTHVSWVLPSTQTERLTPEKWPIYARTPLLPLCFLGPPVPPLGLSYKTRAVVRVFRSSRTWSLPTSANLLSRGARRPDTRRRAACENRF